MLCCFQQLSKQAEAEAKPSSDKAKLELTFVLKLVEDKTEAQLVLKVVSSFAVGWLAWRWVVWKSCH